MKRVLLLHTGGTLGMAAHVSPDPARPAPLAPDRYAREILEVVPELARIAHVETQIVCNLDSSDMHPAQWTEIAERIIAARERFDGFVIVHGTDTMSYTASALSFALAGLAKPVILTGSQRPLAEVRTDARHNLIDSVDLATRDVPEVGICFDGRLLRGNRATKGDAWAYAAFASPGCAPLARLGVDVELASHIIRSQPSRTQFSTAFDPGVAVFHVTPGVNPELVQSWARHDRLKGLVLAAFGLGNVPMRPASLAHAVGDAVASGLTCVAVTQGAGRVDLDRYEGGAALREAGVLSGGGMTIEAAVTKLMHALALHPDDPQTRSAYVTSDISGER